jgi:hypothetical protein
MTDISIVIVSWNTKAMLLNCLHSIFEANGRCVLQVIVVDNGSSDGSPEAVQNQFPDVDLIQAKENLGFAKANNIGIKLANGRHICLINSDVVVSSGCLDHMSAYMDAHNSVGMVAPKILNSDLTLQLSCREFPSLWNSFCRALALDSMFPNLQFFSGSLMQFWPHDKSRSVDVVSGCFWMLRKEAVADVGPLEEQFFMYSEDVDYCKRYWKKGWEIVYLPEVDSIHHGGASSSLHPVRFQIEGLKARLQYWRKHHGRLAQAAFVGISLLHQLRRMVQGVVLYLLHSSQRQCIVTDLRASVICSLWLFRRSKYGHRRVV